MDVATRARWATLSSTLVAWLGCSIAGESARTESIDPPALETSEISAIFRTRCAACHGADLRGSEGGSPLRGSAFQGKWPNAAPLADYIQKAMPPNARAA